MPTFEETYNGIKNRGIKTETFINNIYKNKGRVLKVIESYNCKDYTAIICETKTGIKSIGKVYENYSNPVFLI